MSDTILRIFPADPELATDDAAAGRAEAALRELFPGADQIDVERYATVTLIDCGENLERITCPRCGQELDTEWWGDQLELLLPEEETRPAPASLTVVVPCYGATLSLTELRYEWPVGFARVTFDVWNPEPWPGDDTSAATAVVAGALGAPAKSLWAYY